MTKENMDKVQILRDEIDQLLIGLEFEELMNTSISKTYNNVCSAICRIANNLFSEVNIIECIELDVRKDSILDIVEITGYVKVHDSFAHIESLYSKNKKVGIYYEL